MTAVDVEVLEELGELVEDLTTTGKPSLDETQIKRLKNICKISNSYVNHVFHLVMTQLKKNHAEIRLSSFQIISELFSRSHHFRELLLGEFRIFLDLAVGSDQKKLLPPPYEVAKTLKTKAIDAIESWYQKYGSHYKKLDLGYQFLKRIKHVEFDAISNRTLVERRRAEDREQRKQRILQKKVDKVENEMAEEIGHIELCLTEMNNCFKLLLPPPDEYEVHGLELSSDKKSSIIESQERDDDASTCENTQETTGNTNQIVDTICASGISIEKVVHSQDQTTDNQGKIDHQEGENADNDTEMDVLKSHGLGSRTYEINIKVNDMQPSIDENEDNTIVLETVREMNKEITHNYLPMINQWLQVFSKAGHNQQRIQSIIDLKRQLQSAKDKFIELNISPKKEIDVVDDADESVTDDECDDDDDFVDVPEKEGVEYIPPEKRAEYGLEPLNDSNTAGPSTTDKGKAIPSQSASQVDIEAFLKQYGFTLKDAEDPTSHARAILEARKKGGEITLKTTQSESAKAHVLPVATTTTSSQDNNRRKKLLEKAPVVNFDMDLYHWDDPNYEPPKIIRSHNFNNYWASKDADTEQVFEEAKTSMIRRKICFGGKFEPVKWSCRAPLPSGKLCPRKDRLKCPFHGVIVARDGTGKPIGDGLSPDVLYPSTSTANQMESWKDIQHDIEAATGIDLKQKGKKRKARKPASDKDKLSRKQKYARLTDINKSSKTPRSRLETKVLSKKAMKRIAEEMDNLATKKILDKFGDQFNYQLH